LFNNTNIRTKSQSNKFFLNKKPQVFSWGQACRAENTPLVENL
jgi:hypothetical protein